MLALNLTWGLETQGNLTWDIIPKGKGKFEIESWLTLAMKSV